MRVGREGGRECARGAGGVKGRVAGRLGCTWARGGGGGGDEGEHGRNVLCTMQNRHLNVAVVLSSPLHEHSSKQPHSRKPLTPAPFSFLPLHFAASPSPKMVQH